MEAMNQMIGTTRDEERWLERIRANREHLETLSRAVAVMASSASDYHERAAAQDLEGRERTQLLTSRALLDVLLENRAQLERALQRMREGSYGICEDCGVRIPPERLGFRPESTRCVDCQRLHDDGRRIA
jgi:DnaK suppressor protein